jgi:hypothetical protein
LIGGGGFVGFFLEKKSGDGGEEHRGRGLVLVVCWIVVWLSTAITGGV